MSLCRRGRASVCPVAALQLEARAGRSAGARGRLAEEPSVALASPTLDERRTVTVLFADLSGYTAVAARLDPESVKRQLERILGRLGEEVVAYGGYVDKFIGDNVMAIFGAPVAHGDDAERAVRAGMAMQGAMDELNEPLAAQHGVTFELCVGINTGEVLAGHVGDSYTVIGDTVNVAARMQAAARPGSVTVGEATHRATREAIDYSALQGRWCSRARPSRCLAWEALAADAQPAAALGGARAISAGGPRPRARSAARSARAGAAQARTAPRDRDRRSRRRKVAASAPVRAGAAQPGRPAADAPRALPALWVEHRLLAARRGHSRGVRDRGRRSARGGVGEAVRPPR